MSNIVIREVKPEEVAIIEDIAVQAWEPIFKVRRELMGNELFLKIHPDWAKSKAGQIRKACGADNPTIVRVVEMDDRIAGFMTLHIDANTGIGEIGNNAVRPDFQGQGIGKKMYAEAFRLMRESGMTHAKVSTGGDPAHIAARTAYEKSGFTRQVPVVHYYREL